MRWNHGICFLFKSRQIGFNSVKLCEQSATACSTHTIFCQFLPAQVRLSWQSIHFGMRTKCSMVALYRCRQRRDSSWLSSAENGVEGKQDMVRVPPHLTLPALIPHLIIPLMPVCLLVTHMMCLIRELLIFISLPRFNKV